MLPAEAMSKGLELARELFETIGRDSFDGSGFARAAYGPGEELAHDRVAAAAAALGMRIERDAARNTWMTLEGEDRDGPPLVIGSHLDAVPNGGNYDGLAGVLAGLACAAAFRHAAVEPIRSLSVLAIRAEESAWFGAQHVGSRALLGTLSDGVLDTARRVDSGRTLREHMIEAGADMVPIGQGRPLRDPAGIAAFLELHIEQGPVLTRADAPLGIVTGIRGNRRCRRIRCQGESGHSGTLERADRHDAVLAVCDLITTMEAFWDEVAADGEDLVMTFGKLSTNAATHSVTTVPGEVELSFDARSHSPDVLAHVENRLHAEMDRVAASRGVAFDHDPFTGDPPIAMNAGMRKLLERGSTQLGIPAISISSGAGHDAGDFAMAGVPSAMIFVRSENGSHNPDEHMAFNDFAEGVRLVSWFVEEFQQMAGPW